MTVTEKRAKSVEYMTSRKGLNDYAQGGAFHPSITDVQLECGDI